MPRARSRSMPANASRVAFRPRTSRAWCCSWRPTTAGCAPRRISSSMAAGSESPASEEGTQIMRLIQYRKKDGRRKVGLVTDNGEHAHPLKGVSTVYELANLAIEKGRPLAKLVEKHASDERVDYLAL